MFHTPSSDATGDDLAAVAFGLTQALGPQSGTLFGAALLVSGLGSSSVGTLAGQVIMAGFIRRSIPQFVRRGVTMAPALVILGLGVPPGPALVVSQVCVCVCDTVCAVALQILS